MITIDEISEYVKTHIMKIYPGIELNIYDEKTRQYVDTIKTIPYTKNGVAIQNEGAINFFKQTAFKIYFKNKVNRIVIKNKYKPLIYNLKTYEMDSYKLHFCIDIREINELSAINDVIVNTLEDLSTKDVGCCYRYTDCSDTKQCIENNANFFLRCAYRQNLKNGKIFYGKNKTI